MLYKVFAEVVLEFLIHCMRVESLKQSSLPCFHLVYILVELLQLQELLQPSRKIRDKTSFVSIASSNPFVLLNVRMNN